MSRAFVKEQDVDYLEMPERPVSEHPNDVTEAGLAQIENALAAAKDAYAIAQASADRAARDRADSAGPGRHIGSVVRSLRDHPARRRPGADVPDRRRGRSRPCQRFDLSRLAACEIDVRKARRRCGRGRQRASRDRGDQLWGCGCPEQATPELRRRRS